MTSSKQALGTVIVAAIGLLHASGAAAQDVADPDGRAGHWNTYLHTVYSDSQSVDSDKRSSAHLDSSFGWGLGFGYDFNDHWGIEINGAWREADYQATITPDTGNPNLPQKLSGTIDTSTVALNATYNFLERALTPFVTAGVGGTYVDTNIPTGSVQPVCWWDPWWGYYCAPAYPTRSDTFFSYNVGAGARWDSRGPLFLRGLVSEQWVDVGSGAGTPDFFQVQLDVGFRF
jgi:opacity protein-like surface antigen